MYFTGFFRDNIWGNDASRSGPGSSPAVTMTLSRELPGYLARIGCRTLLDIPCGDWAWMRHVNLDGLDYTGADIVAELILDLEQEHAKPGVRFQVLDILSSRLPQVDVIVCRDLLNHLTHAQVRAAVKNMKRSGSTYLVTTTYPEVQANPDIAMGDSRPLNQQLSPFNWPPPLSTLFEDCPASQYDRGDKTLGAWRLSDL
jgi:cyclopropane fatty-acyl-phospholipid synthase-like methyltransferase